MIRFRAALPADRPTLTKLWQDGFGDPVTFIDLFFESGFAPERSRIALVDDTPAAGLYWFDGLLGDERYAYIYAVATDPAFQGRGIASALMADAHAQLAREGYAGAILSPGSESLFRFYGRMGYKTVGFVSETLHTALGQTAVQPVEPEEFAALRRTLLPKNGIRQEGANLSYLSRFALLYAGDGFAAAVTGPLVAEFLGDETRIPGFLGAVGLEQATVRTPGQDRPLIMGLRFDGAEFPPVYFGFPFD